MTNDTYLHLMYKVVSEIMYLTKIFQKDPYFDKFNKECCKTHVQVHVLS